jgi:hypothetical protein
MPTPQYLDLLRLYNLNAEQLTTFPTQAQEIKPKTQNITPNIIPPAPQREFRGAWIATVLNIDWL